MTVTVELEEDQVDRLLTVLDENVQAVEPTEAVRWTNAAASRIDQVRQEIAEQAQ